MRVVADGQIHETVAAGVVGIDSAREFGLVADNCDRRGWNHGAGIIRHRAGDATEGLLSSQLRCAGEEQTKRIPL